MAGAGMGSDITPGEEPRLAFTAGGRWLTFSAPYGGSYELWRVSTTDGDVVRLTEGRHYLSAFDQITLPKGRGSADPGTRIVYHHERLVPDGRVVAGQLRSAAHAPITSERAPTRRSTSASVCTSVKQ